MLGTLRFRLTALFLAVVVVFAVVSIALAVHLFQDVTREQSIRELEREAAGLAQLYAESALRASDEGAAAPEFAAKNLELATGDELFYVGASLFPGQRFGLTRLSREALGDVELDRDRLVTFEFTPPGEERTLLAAAQPVQLVRGTEPFGWLIVAKPVAELREQWLTLLGRLVLALAVGSALAALLFGWLSRRLTEPVRALTRATHDVAAGRYDVEVPPAQGRDEISLLSDRFRRMVDKLAEAETLKRSFLMSVSHELRTPLTAIRGHVEALREGIVADPEQVRASLDVIAAEADRLERLVGDVLDLARLQAHRFTVRREEVDLGRVLEHAYGAFAEEARRRGIDYRVQTEGEPPVIVSDGDRVLQVITNLLSNAFRWTPDGGRVELRLSASDGRVRVDVVDTGPGIPASERARIFDPFISSHVDGSGLGLPIAKELAVALGGRVEVESEPGRGSTFRLVLPGARATEAAGARS
ncbi:MAG TPA: HAMP domain-containing sensor histidine kinase [Gaiellaceae bacterium]|nr:HAMP domain-containing sensor histidine kinase [Gaiellaceae bacterium]